MTFGEIKQTKEFINAPDYEVRVNGGEPVEEEYYYIDEVCLLDKLLVVGTGSWSDGTLRIDLVCSNWDKRFDIDWYPE